MVYSTSTVTISCIVLVIGSCINLGMFARLIICMMTKASVATTTPRVKLLGELFETSFMKYLTLQIVCSSIYTLICILTFLSVGDVVTFTPTGTKALVSVSTIIFALIEVSNVNLITFRSKFLVEKGSALHKAFQVLTTCCYALNLVCVVALQVYFASGRVVFNVLQVVTFTLATFFMLSIDCTASLVFGRNLLRVKTMLESPEQKKSRETMQTISIYGLAVGFATALGLLTLVASVSVASWPDSSLALLTVAILMVNSVGTLWSSLKIKLVEEGQVSGLNSKHKVTTSQINSTRSGGEPHYPATPVGDNLSQIPPKPSESQVFNDQINNSEV
eukprot:TRINITY_DN16846_c0_g1_i1.p1 TRINITY_DN16846_c0_g1~~TRINITY_DN16846_c0_g1_i1.p1  ORF type:complete len:333 (-),score=77.11 TRINITY_DN16846_c0_g1_i1:95-1093(-)